MRTGTCALVLALALGSAAPSFAQGKPAPKPAPAAQAAQPVDLITKGRQLFEDQQYEESIQTLSAALVRPNNTTEQKVEIYRLLALNYITIGRKEEGENAVRGLLVVNPDYSLPATESPRFRDFFAQSRAKWEAEGRPGFVKEAPPQKALLFKHTTPPQAEQNTSVELRGKIDDPEGRIVSVRLYYRTGSKGDFSEGTATYDAGRVYAQIPASAVKAPLVDYYFEAVGSDSAILTSRGDAQNPLRIAVPEGSKSGWVLPVVGGTVLGAAAIVGILALAGVFSGSDSPNTANVSISVGPAGR